MTHHNSGTDNIGALGVDQPGRQEVEVICNAICDNSMPSIVPSLSSGTKFHGRTENIDELAFSLEICGQHYSIV
jgi:hypothetical protein